MDMSKAALPPRYIPISEEDRNHPRFNEYMVWRGNMSRLMVEASSFADWLYQKEFQEKCDNWCNHPKYNEFLNWMRATKAGARKCPAGAFPENFKFWLNGNRW